MFVEVDKELQEIFPVYLRNRQEDLMNLEASLERKDFNVLKQIGHKVAGNAEGFGLQEFGGWARELEAKAKDRDYESCAAIVSKMKRFIKDLQPKYI